jgi:hypothetical protein
MPIRRFMHVSKTEKVFRALELAGESGVHSFDLQGVGGWRYSARIYDLRNDGKEIISIPERKGDAMGVRYYLVERSR